ncbi:cytochrome P450 [Helicostylum pulchrum]|nr:cytochrome P450 [Helicostylum pulchrum]
MNFSLTTDQKALLPVLGITASVTLLYTTYRLLTPSPYKKIPIPGSRFPYVGHMFSLGSHPGDTIADWHKSLGPIINIRMGVQDWILIDDPFLAHKVFVTNGAATSYRPHNVYGHDYHNVGGKGVSFSQPDGHWKVTRAAALSVLAPKHVTRYMPTIHREAKDLVARLLESSRKNGSVDPFVDFKLYSMNVIATTIFCKRYDTVTNPEFIKLTKVTEQTNINCAVENDLSNFLPIVSLYDYFFGKHAAQRRYVESERNPFLRRLIEEARKEEGPNMIKSFAEDGFELTKDQELGIIGDMLVGGNDTQSATLAWNIAIMCNHPEIQQKVASEIDQFVEHHGRAPTFKERDQVPYCIAVMKESIRYRTTTSFGLAHTSKIDLCVDGYLIPKNATIISSMESMHMNPKVYNQPTVFNPDRYINSQKTMQSSANGRIEDRDHFNFGWGRRVCPAIYLAETEMFMAFIAIFSTCYVEPNNNQMPNIHDKLSGALTICPKSYQVKFIKRV